MSSDHSQLSFPKPWTSPTCEELGIPLFPEAGLAHCPGRAVGWCPGVKTQGIADWYIVQWHTGNIRHYLEHGGDHAKMIIHFLSFDEGVIDPLWTNWDKRLARMKEFKVHTIIGVDFSAWADAPMILQLFNVYKSAVINRDLHRAGFKIVPQPNWSATQIQLFQLNYWPASAKTILVDAHHFGTGDRERFNAAVFWRGAKLFRQRWPDVEPWLWCSTQRHALMWPKLTGGQCQFVPTRSAVLQATIRTAERVKKARKEAV